MFAAAGIVAFCGFGMSVGRVIGDGRGRADAGMWLGLIWPLGWLIAWCLPRTLEAKARDLVALERALERERQKTGRP